MEYLTVTHTLVEHNLAVVHFMGKLPVQSVCPVCSFLSLSYICKKYLSGAPYGSAYYAQASDIKKK